MRLTPDVDRGLVSGAGSLCGPEVVGQESGQDAGQNQYCGRLKRDRTNEVANVDSEHDTFDGKLWNASARQPTWRSRLTQGIFLTPRLKWLTWIIHTMPHKHADRIFRETKSGVPWSARWVRFTWGYVPMAEPDPWDMPSGAPPNEWPYDFWIDVTRRQNQRQRRGPCGNKVQVHNPYA